MIVQVDVIPDGMSLTLPADSLGFSPQSLGLALPDDTSFEDWQELGLRFASGHRAVALCIGDWIIFGERKFRRVDSEAYDIAVAATGLDRGTLQNYAWVARSIPMEERNPRLSFEHHKALAPLPKEKREEWAVLIAPRTSSANSEQSANAAPPVISARRLRASIRIATDAPRIVPPEEIVRTGMNVGHDNHIPHLQRLETILRKNLPGMDEDQRAALKDDLGPLLALIAPLIGSAR